MGNENKYKCSCGYILNLNTCITICPKCSAEIHKFGREIESYGGGRKWQ